MNIADDRTVVAINLAPCPMHLSLWKLHKDFLNLIKMERADFRWREMKDEIRTKIEMGKLGFREEKIWKLLVCDIIRFVEFYKKNLNLTSQPN